MAREGYRDRSALVRDGYRRLELGRDTEELVLRPLRDTGNRPSLWLLRDTWNLVLWLGRDSGDLVLRLGGFKGPSTLAR